ncbi:hypothetical protein VP01_11829g1, partial [Puccinia sorghi]
IILLIKQRGRLLLVFQQEVKSMTLRLWLSISAVNPPQINLNPFQMKDQFNTYKEKYKKFHTKSISTGFGLTDEYCKAEISKINEKLESMCPHYHAINKFLGGQAFINPQFKVDAQADKETATSSPSEPAGN